MSVVLSDGASDEVSVYFDGGRYEGEIMSTANEQRYYLSLKIIAKYATTEWLRRNSEKKYGLAYEEALEGAYENIREVAAAAIRGKREPQHRKGDVK